MAESTIDNSQDAISIDDELLIEESIYN